MFFFFCYEPTINKTHQCQSVNFLYDKKKMLFIFDEQGCYNTYMGQKWTLIEDLLKFIKIYNFCRITNFFYQKMFFRHLKYKMMY